MENPVDPNAARAYDRTPEATPTVNTISCTAWSASSARVPVPAIRPGKGVQEMKKPTQFGIVTITRRTTPKKGRQYWLLRYTDPTTGADVRRRVSDQDIAEVKAMAKHLTREAYLGKGYLAGKPKAPTIAEGLAEAIRLANTRETTTRDRAQRAKQFVRWLGENYPHVRTWDDLKPSMVRAYQLDMEGRGRAYDTIRLNLSPIKLAWRHLAENFPEIVKPMPRIKLKTPPKREIQCLGVNEVLALIEWLKTNAPDLWAMACLQGLAGLRMLEAAALRVQDVDLKAGTVMITDTGLHAPKSHSSHRTLPVCGHVLEALRVAIANQEVRPATGELFVNALGNLWTQGSLSHRWTQKLRSAGRDLCKPKLATTPARKLRAAFATMAGRAEIPDRLVKAYLGHAPGDMLGEHYRRIGLDELQSVSERIEALTLEHSGAGPWQHSGNIRYRSAASD